MSERRVALFPGSFDPFTNGHLDLARRASVLFDRVVIAVADNSAKTSLFSAAERVEMIESAVGGLRGASAMHFSGLLVDCARKIGAQAIIRGLRAVSDFEFEFQMALMNRRLAPGIEVAFLMPSQEFTYLNSTLVKEVARHGGEIRGLVPALVERRLRERFAPARPARTTKARSR
ncbi:MAG TPA: pantetheine-phosphate adenylyltransferase [Candidatus Eisenbacteria bacterium]|jgi:pantetheine-phosphate adenylyltransferase